MKPASFAYIFGIKVVLSSSVFLEELLENIGSLNIETYITHMDVYYYY